MFAQFIAYESEVRSTRHNFSSLSIMPYIQLILHIDQKTTPSTSAYYFSPKMSLSSSFDLLSFNRKVQDALQSVERTLELERKPQLAADVDHTYGAKYGLVNLTSNAAIIAYINCFEKLGLDAAVLKSIDKTKPATLRFESSTSCKYLKEVQVDVPVGRSYEENEETKGSDSSKTTTRTRVVKVRIDILWLCDFVDSIKSCIVLIGL